MHVENDLTWQLLVLSFFYFCFVYNQADYAKFLNIYLETFEDYWNEIFTGIPRHSASNVRAIAGAGCIYIFARLFVLIIQLYVIHIL